MVIDPQAQDSFIALLRLSGLIEEAKLAKVLDNLAHSDSLPFGNSIASLTMMLVGQGLLTNWQVAKLREGKHKGFVLDHLLLLDYLCSSRDSLTYLARDQNRSVLCKVKVFRQISAEPPPYRYEIEDL